MRTVSYSDLLGRFTSAIGVDSLLGAEETLFKRSLNDRIRGIWTRAKWPPLAIVVEKTIGAVSNANLNADKAVQVDNSELFDVHGVWDRNPYTDNRALMVEYNLVGDYLVLPNSLNTSSVFVVGASVPASDYGDGTTAIPQFMERMLLAYALADYYRAESQNDKAIAEEQRAEEYFMQELERFERMGSQNQIKVNVYPTNLTSLLVRQTTV